MNLKKILGLAIRAAREREGKSREEFSQECGVSLSLLENYETGKGGFKLGELQSIASALGLRLVVTLRGADEGLDPRELAAAFEQAGERERAAVSLLLGLAEDHPRRPASTPEADHPLVAEVAELVRRKPGSVAALEGMVRVLLEGAPRARGTRDTTGTGG